MRRAEPQPETAAPKASPIDHWRATCAVWVNDLCMHGVHPPGYVYAWRRCHGELTGETEEGTTADGKTYVVRTRRRRAGQEVQDRIQARAARLLRELYDTTGIPVGHWSVLSQRVMASRELFALVEAAGLLPQRPEDPAVAERERRAGITEEQRQANADALAETF